MRGAQNMALFFTLFYVFLLLSSIYPPFFVSFVCISRAALLPWQHSGGREGGRVGGLA